MGDDLGSRFGNKGDRFDCFLVDKLCETMEFIYDRYKREPSKSLKLSIEQYKTLLEVKDSISFDRTSYDWISLGLTRVVLGPN